MFKPKESMGDRHICYRGVGQEESYGVEMELEICQHEPMLKNKYFLALSSEGTRSNDTPVAKSTPVPRSGFVNTIVSQKELGLF